MTVKQLIMRDRDLSHPANLTNRFYVSGSFIRGPARPSGSGYVETVIRCVSEGRAHQTAATLNEFFDKHDKEVAALKAEIERLKGVQK